MKRKVKFMLKAVPFIPKLFQVKRESLIIHMFKEDIYQGIMPIGGRTTNHPKFSIHFEGVNGDFNKVMNLWNLETRNTSNHVTETICDIVESTAARLVQSGRAYYEIVRKRDTKEYYLTPFTYKRLFKIFPYYIQLVSIEKYSIKKWFVVLHKSVVWKVDIPSVLGGPDGFKRTLKNLQRFDDLGPNFWRDELFSNQLGNYFNFNEYMNRYDLYIQHVTRQWGWNKRDCTTQNKTEYYVVHQFITMAWAKAVLREHIVSEINLLIKRLGWDCRIVISGIPSSNDLRSLREKLNEGKVSFDEVINVSSLL